MRILGIDPGYGITGFGVIEAERGKSRLIQCGAITTPASESAAGLSHLMAGPLSPHLNLQLDCPT